MNNHAEATRRRQAILRAIASEPIHSQQEILEALLREGFAATQPTVSRDIRELGLVKLPAGYVAPSELAATPLAPVFPFIAEEKLLDRLEETILRFVTSVEKAGTLVILRTRPAEAQPVARAIDEAKLDEIAGTIAGDDTIFLAARSSRHANALVRRLSDLLAPSTDRRRARR